MRRKERETVFEPSGARCRDNDDEGDEDDDEEEEGNDNVPSMRPNTKRRD